MSEPVGDAVELGLGGWLTSTVGGAVAVAVVVLVTVTVGCGSEVVAGGALVSTSPAGGMGGTAGAVVGGAAAIPVMLVPDPPWMAWPMASS